VDLEAIHLLYACNDWASRHVVETAERLSAQQLLDARGASFGSISGTLGHILGAEMLWLGRWRGAGWIDLPNAEVVASLPSLCAAWEHHRRNLARFLGELTPERLQTTIHYTTAAGQPLAEPLWLLMVHVVNHGTHHRSEAAEMLTRCGAPPPSLELVHYFRAQHARAEGPL